MKNLRSHLKFGPQKSEPIYNEEGSSSQRQQQNQEIVLGNPLSHHSSQLPPRSGQGVRRRISKVRIPLQQKPSKEWDSSFAVQSKIPEYKAYNDQYAVGYMGMLKKNGKYGKYLKEVAKPGGLRAVK